MKKLFAIGYSILILFTQLFLFQGAVLAQTCDNPNDPLGVGCGAQSGLAAYDIRITVARIIASALELLGIIAIVLILYAGFMWMTSAGSEEKIETAKKTLWASVIGLAIILSAYALTRFILIGLYNATTPNRTFNASQI